MMKHEKGAPGDMNSVVLYDWLVGHASNTARLEAKFDLPMNDEWNRFYGQAGELERQSPEMFERLVGEIYDESGEAECRAASVVLAVEHLFNHPEFLAVATRALHDDVPRVSTLAYDGLRECLVSGLLSPEMVDRIADELGRFTEGPGRIKA